MRRHHDTMIDPPAPEGFARAGWSEEMQRYLAYLKQRYIEAYVQQGKEPSEEEFINFSDQVQQDFLAARKLEVTPEMEAAAAQTELEEAMRQLEVARQAAQASLLVNPPVNRESVKFAQNADSRGYPQTITQPEERQKYFELLSERLRETFTRKGITPSLEQKREFARQIEEEFVAAKQERARPATSDDHNS